MGEEQEKQVEIQYRLTTAPTASRHNQEALQNAEVATASKYATRERPVRAFRGHDGENINSIATPDHANKLQYDVAGIHDRLW